MERPTNWRFVNPVSKVNGNCRARSTTLAPAIIPSSTARAATTTQSLVWKALCAQSNWGSSAKSWCATASCTWVWRISSRAPSVAVFRHAAASPKRAIRSSPSMPMYSTRATAPKCALAIVFQPSASFGKTLERPRAALTA